MLGLAFVLKDEKIKSVKTPKYGRFQVVRGAPFPSLWDLG